MDKATSEYKKYKAKTLSAAENDYFNAIEELSDFAAKNNRLACAPR